jgi:hypothetical protein
VKLEKVLVTLTLGLNNPADVSWLLVLLTQSLPGDFQFFQGNGNLFQRLALKAPLPP